MWRTDSLVKTLMMGKFEGRRRGQQRMRWLDCIINSMDMHLSKLRERVKERERKAWRAAVHGVTKSQRWLSDWTMTKGDTVVKNLPARRGGFDPWVRKIPWRRKWQPTPVFLPGKVPWTKQSGGLQPMGLLKRHSLVTGQQHMYMIKKKNRRRQRWFKWKITTSYSSYRSWWEPKLIA